MTQGATARAASAGVVAAAVGAALVHAAPALTARGPLRRSMPRLSGRGRSGGVALTFDDGPDADGTPAVLDALAALGWTATFFLLGSQVDRNPEIARSIVAAGHEVGVHGHQHRNHLARSGRWVTDDLRLACSRISAVTGVRPRWFRPPYGVLTAGSLRAAADLDLTPVLWTAWGRDWEGPPADRVLAHLLRSLGDGGTVLLHDSDCTSRPGSWRSTVAVLAPLASELDRRGLAVRPLRSHLVRSG
jgi:peptidoglycan/xylan/chitin deacetylase (PgdA/CDA1 family)